MPTQILSESLETVLNRIKNASQLLLFTDFDGTLVPISNKPMECKPTAEVAATLTKINAHPTAMWASSVAGSCPTCSHASALTG